MVINVGAVPIATGATLQEYREGAYRLQWLRPDEISIAILSEWRSFLEHRPSTSIMQDTAWLCERSSEHLLLCFIYRGDSLLGFAPFLRRDWPLKCQFGEITLARLPLRRLCLVGDATHFPQDAAAYELLFRELLSLEGNSDAVYLSNVPVDSFLWKFAQVSPMIRESFTPYMPDSPAPRVLLRLSGSFEDYMQKFSSKHRKNLRRTARMFQEPTPGGVHAIRFTRPDEVDAFLDQAVEISRKTYQWKLLGLGLRSKEDLRKYLSFLARHGWLRSYLLFRGETPCAFVIGVQYRSNFFLDDMGYDPQWQRFSVGKILQLKVIEDLFQHNRPEVYDLGDYGLHKSEFGTETLMQGKMLLFRPGVYSAIARWGHYGCRSISEWASTQLEQLGWKKRLKKTIRLWNTWS